MIEMGDYSREEIDFIYTAVEEAVKTHGSVNINKISEFIRNGDFYLCGQGSNGTFFTFNGLKLVEKHGDEDRIYTCLIQPTYKYGAYQPDWKPVITIDDRFHSSSGDLHMIKKENRYMDLHAAWITREERFKECHDNKRTAEENVM